MDKFLINHLFEILS